MRLVLPLDIFLSPRFLASCTNVYELMTRCLFLFKVGCIISTKYLNVPYDTVPIASTIVLIG